MSTHPYELISAYADGELPESQAAQVKAHLDTCTECARDLALIHSMTTAMHNLRDQPSDLSVWPAVHSRITQPVGWLLFAAGVAVLAMLGVIEWFRDGALTLQWFATTAVAVGLALLALGIGYEQYRDWRTSPYKDLER